MTEVDVVAEQEDEEQLANVLLLLVSIQRLIAFEFVPNVCQFFVYSLHLGLLALA